MSYFYLKVPEGDEVQLYVAARAVTVKKVKHPFKSVVPKNSSVDMSLVECNGERSCLKCDKNDFDPDSDYTYSLISLDEHTRGKKE